MGMEICLAFSFDALMGSGFMGEDKDKDMDMDMDGESNKNGGGGGRRTQRKCTGSHMTLTLSISSISITPSFHLQMEEIKYSLLHLLAPKCKKNY